jgi:transcriptional regulator with GAF, ATPase, and Fis domain/serine/threonine protein kinase/Tfp pilus assembly protein PilF
MCPANSVGRLGRWEGDARAGGPVGSLIGGRYRIGGVLGSGGEGETFSAIDDTTGTPCAVKVFRAEVGVPDPVALARARVEFEQLVGMRHPGLVRAHDLGRDAGRLYLVTELISGASISSIAELADDEQRRNLFVRAARELADALAYLHGRGVLHGDVAPDNVRLAEDGRAVLIDLGASGAPSTGGARGTMGFAAPEALVGSHGHLSDLFGLGATLFAAWTGTGPFGVGGSAVARMLAGSAPLLSTVRRGLPDGWDQLIGSLLQAAPERRPPSARSVLREMGRLTPGSPCEPMRAPFPAGDPLAGIFVGRGQERTSIETALEQLGDGVYPYAVFAVVGGAGSGRNTLIDRALRDLAIAQVAEAGSQITVFRGTLRRLMDWLSVPWKTQADSPAWKDDPVREQQRHFARIVSALDARSAREPMCVVLAGGDDELQFALFVAGASASGRWLILLAAGAPLGRVGAFDLVLSPLSAQDVHLLAARAAGDEPPPEAIARVTAAAAGHAATIAILIRQLVEAMRSGEADRFAPARDAAFDDFLIGSFARLPAPARRLVAMVALGLDAEAALGPGRDDAAAIPQRGVDGERTQPAAAVRDALTATDAARAAGWLTGDAGWPRLPSAAHETIVRKALSDPDLRGVAQHALGLIPEHDGRRGACFEALGEIDRAAAAFLTAAQPEVEGKHGNPTQAAGWLEEAARLAPARLTIDQRLFLAGTLALQGRGEAALAALPSHLAGVSGPDSGRVAERRAWLLGRAGDLAGARNLLEQTIADTTVQVSHEMSIFLRARLARVLVSMGRFAEAIAAADPIVGDPAAGAVALESAVLAHAYAGDPRTARRWHSELAARDLPPARASYIAALLDHLAGDLQSALSLYRRALPQAESAGDIHTLGAIALNMGALAAEAGRYGEALAMQDRAIRELGRLGATTELATALFNAGMLLIELGDFTDARGMLDRLRREIAGRTTLFSAASVLYLEGELAQRQGDDAGALDLFTSVAESPGPDGGGTRAAAVLARAEILARLQRSGEAHAILDGLQVDGSSPRAAAEVRLTRGRILLAAPALDVDAALLLAPALQADGAAAEKAGRQPRAWRCALTAARLFHRAGKDQDAAATLTTARRLFEEIRMFTPIDHRAGLEHDRDARFTTELARQGGSNESAAAQARAARSAQAEDRLRRLLRINKRLNSELRLPRLLELIMDTVIELTDAERGFILLEDEKGELTVKVARNIDQETLEAGAFELSRSIARQAAAGGTPIVTIDAAGDPRFREAVSVSDLHLRSVLAVPLQVKGRSVGTLYVDNRLRQGAFGEDDIQLVLDFSEQAGIAIGNARMLSELRKRERQIEVLNRRLESELAVRKEELVGMKQELRENRVALAIRYDYANIVGRTPRMLDLFRLLDRLTDTVLPVVIQGESGTGKELVARALHFNGPRRARPFVSENCAAIPETLLESTLFGAVRGAYTGADHDSRGLFEVADGGTLFLDEVGEMSPAMQGKLLRVLQTGELRRVGSERIRKVDVRIIAATNRDLGRMVEAGQFRQDLFFRLSVAPIALPPLRDRREDIPAIIDHILRKIAGAASPDPTHDPKAPGSRVAEPRRVDPAAMARLVAYRWPGNVRELENELMRAAALSADRITISDLSPHVAGDAESALSTLEDPDSLSLRPRVERLERALLREALSRTGGNQTRAAQALGLSRFGLQKKLRRYHIGEHG